MGHTMFISKGFLKEQTRLPPALSVMELSAKVSSQSGYNACWPIIEPVMAQSISVKGTINSYPHGSGPMWSGQANTN